MALISIGQKVSMLMRTGVWVSQMTVLNIANGLITVTDGKGNQQTMDMVRDVAIVETTSLISI